MEQLLEIISRCKCSVTLSVNSHKDYHQTVSEHISEHNEVVDPSLLDEMIRLDTVVQLQFYPHSPIGFYVIYHYDVKEALKIAVQSLDEMDS